MDDYLNLIRRIFDELLGEPLHSSVTTKNALTVIPILIDQMVERDAADRSGSYAAGHSPGNVAPKNAPKKAPLGADVTLSNKPSKLSPEKRAALPADFFRRSTLQDRVDLLLGKRK